MKLGEKMKELTQPTRKQLGVTFYSGNRVYYVDVFKRPHTGEVIMVDNINRSLTLINVTNINSELASGSSFLIVSMDKCIKTDEIYLGKPNDYDKFIRRYYDGKGSLDLAYENMPKKVINPRAADQIHPLLLMRDGYYLELEKYPGLWLMVARQTYPNLEPSYVLVNERGEEKIPALYFQRCYGMVDEGCIQALPEDVNPSDFIYTDDVLRVYTPDPGVSSDVQYDPNHMTIAYQKPKTV